MSMLHQQIVFGMRLASELGEPVRSSRAGPVHAEHGEIVHNISDRDPDGAHAAMARHLKLSRHRLLGFEVPSIRAEPPMPHVALRSEEHTSELQSLMRISYAVFCLKKKRQKYIK